MTESREAIETKIAELKAELQERRSALPAHSIRPHQLLILEELEEEIAVLQAKLEG